MQPLKENIGKSTKQDVSDSSVKSEIKQDNRQEKVRFYEIYTTCTFIPMIEDVFV